jgi:hypothetical protein
MSKPVHIQPVCKGCRTEGPMVLFTGQSTQRVIEEIRTAGWTCDDEGTAAHCPKCKPN